MTSRLVLLAMAAAIGGCATRWITLDRTLPLFVADYTASSMPTTGPCSAPTPSAGTQGC